MSKEFTFEKSLSRFDEHMKDPKNRKAHEDFLKEGRERAEKERDKNRVRDKEIIDSEFKLDEEDDFSALKQEAIWLMQKVGLFTERCVDQLGQYDEYTSMQSAKVVAIIVVNEKLKTAKDMYVSDYIPWDISPAKFKLESLKTEIEILEELTPPSVDKEK